jgi:hypothetical protein
MPADWLALKVMCVAARPHLTTGPEGQYRRYPWWSASCGVRREAVSSNEGARRAGSARGTIIDRADGGFTVISKVAGVAAPGAIRGRSSPSPHLHRSQHQQQPVERQSEHEYHD